MFIKFRRGLEFPVKEIYDDAVIRLLVLLTYPKKKKRLLVLL